MSLVDSAPQQTPPAATCRLHDKPHHETAEEHWLGVWGRERRGLQKEGGRSKGED